FIAPSPHIHPIPPFQVLKLFRFYYTTFLKRREHQFDKNDDFKIFRLFIRNVDGCENATIFQMSPLMSVKVDRTLQTPQIL
ncbi:hypothetical protein, partial [Heyndrickxia faecalis]|uniref:hypothetical protein n=1 Tax=Heyndrickxia faecalis TaxID=2824910 RepID=UPI003D20DD3D